MRKSLFAAMTALACAGGGVAHAQGYGYLPQPAYVTAGVTYEDRHRGFTIAGARAGITVLGIDLDGSAGVKLSLHDQPGRRLPYAPPQQPPIYSPGPTYDGGGYVAAGYGQGYVSNGYGQGYATMYAGQGYDGAGYGAPVYAGGGCAQCAPPPPPPCGC